MKSHLLLGSMLVIACCLAGCNVIGALTYKLGPPPSTPAKYVPEQEPAVIVVENYRNPAASEIDAEQLAGLIADEFRKNKIAPLVDDNAVINLRDKDPKAFKNLTIPAIGRAVGARQVVYVDLQGMSIDAAADEKMYKGSMTATVRVIDVATTRTRWPADANQGWPVNLQTPLVQSDQPLTDALIRRKLNDAMAVNIGRLFYKWTNEDEGSNIGRD